MPVEILAYMDLGVYGCRQCECDLLGDRTAWMLETGLAELAEGVVAPPRPAMWAGGAPYCWGCSGSESDGERVARKLAAETSPRPGVILGRVIRKDHSNLTGD